MGGHCFDYAAHIPNELEVGGTDTGRLGAAINTLCWTLNFLLAQLAAFLKHKTGSYVLLPPPHTRPTVSGASERRDA